MRRYYRRPPARILLVVPLERNPDKLLMFAKVVAYDAVGAEVGSVMPLGFLGEDTVTALHAELREQLNNLGS